MSHKFWNTVPVMHESISQDIADSAIGTKDYYQDAILPIHLPSNYEWSEIDSNNDLDIENLFIFLQDNYVQDVNDSFRLQYSKEFLKWILHSPGTSSKYQVLVRQKSNQEIVASIVAQVCDCYIHQKKVKIALINFLCIHKRLRNRRLTPILIKEISKRLLLDNIYQASYTTSNVITHPVSTSRFLNVQNLLKANFCSLGRMTSVSMMKKFHAIQEKNRVNNLRPMIESDLDRVTVLVNDYLKKFDLYQHYSREEIKHLLIPKNNIVNTYVIENLDTKEITDLSSFYTLINKVIGNKSISQIKMAYCMFVISNTVNSTNLINSTMLLAQKEGYDVFNTLDIMDNKKFIENSKFVKGNADVNYYICNWRCADIDTDKLGLIFF